MRFETTLYISIVAWNPKPPVVWNARNDPTVTTILIRGCFRYPVEVTILEISAFTPWYLKHPLFNGCFSWMTPNHGKNHQTSIHLEPQAISDHEIKVYNL